MAPARRPRSRTSQPELPLPVAKAVPSACTTGDDTVTDWRIDEHTRMVGRQGIAAARAQLATADIGGSERPVALDHGRTGRAA
jgi:hypothetical protein